MSNAIGVGAITVTSDRWIVLIRRCSTTYLQSDKVSDNDSWISSFSRAGWTGEHAGRVDRPGGHPEPEDVAQVRREAKIMIMERERQQLIDGSTNQQRP